MAGFAGLWAIRYAESSARDTDPPSTCNPTERSRKVAKALLAVDADFYIFGACTALLHRREQEETNSNRVHGDAGHGIAMRPGMRMPSKWREP